jgi:hypothetical protein
MEIAFLGLAGGVSGIGRKVLFERDVLFHGKDCGRD